MGEYDLVTLGAFNDAFQANLIKSKLDSEGIECYLIDENIGGLNFLYSYAVGGIKLQVRRPDYNSALGLLKEIEAHHKQELSPNKTISCSSCGSGNTEYFKYEKRRFNAMSILLLGFPIIYPEYRYKCNDCNHVWEDGSGKIIRYIKALFYFGIIFVILIIISSVI